MSKCRGTIYTERLKWTPAQFVYMCLLGSNQYQISHISRKGNEVTISLYDNELDVFEEIKLTPDDV